MREGEREREIHEADPQSHTQKLNPILVEEQIYVQYSYSRPLHHILQMGALLAWPTVARDGKSISPYENVWMQLQVRPCLF